LSDGDKPPDVVKDDGCGGGRSCLKGLKCEGF